VRLNGWVVGMFIPMQVANWLLLMEALPCFAQAGLFLLSSFGTATETIKTKEVMSGYYELKKSASGKQMFNLKAGNHEVILTSELYESKEAALNGVESVRKNGLLEGSFEKKLSANNQPFFVVKAANGQIIGKSELYTTEQARDNGIASVRRNCASEKIVELQA
jgi:uncharacterized protein YegP (UPF0339 family)